MSAQSHVIVSKENHVLHIRLNRPDKRNAANFAMLQELTLAFSELDRNHELRCGLVTAEGDHFTAGLDLADVGSHLTPRGLNYVAEGDVDPWGVQTALVTKPVVVAAKGICFTLGIELILAADVAIAAHGTRFAQLEVARGILPFGGATLRFTERCGWGNAMRWMLTGEEFSDREALRIGLVQEAVPADQLETRAREIATRIASSAPMAVQATLANARLARETGQRPAAEALQPELMRLLGTNDARRGFEAFASRSQAVFEGD